MDHIELDQGRLRNPIGLERAYLVARFESAVDTQTGANDADLFLLLTTSAEAALV